MKQNSLTEKRAAVIVRMSREEKNKLNNLAKCERMSVAGFIKWLIGKFERGLIN